MYRQKERIRKMKKKIRILAVMFAMMVMILTSGTMTAYAYVDEAEDEPVIMEETPEETENTPFSVAGNGQLLDDITDDDTKQFLTVQTKNGNTFFMVIDRSRNSENVYMLSLVDENDLAEFLEEEPEPVEEEKPSVIIEDPQSEPVAEEPQPEPEKAGMNMGAVLTILLGAGVVGGYYYFKILKPKREEEEAESEDLEFYDGGAYVNEDEESGQDGEEEEEYTEG